MVLQEWVGWVCTREFFRLDKRVTHIKTIRIIEWFLYELETRTFLNMFSQNFSWELLFPVIW